MAVVVHPDLEIETAKARDLLGTMVPLSDAVRQWANMGALVDGLHRGDFATISRALEDTIAEPRRASLVPGLADHQARGGGGRRPRLQFVGIRPVAVRSVRRPRRRRRGRGRDDGRGENPDRRRAADLRIADRSCGARVLSTCAS